MPYDFKVGWHFAAISCDKSVGIVIKDIASYQPLVLRASLAEISLVKCFDKLSEFAFICIFYKYD